MFQFFREIDAGEAESDEEVVARQDFRAVGGDHQLLDFRRRPYASHAAFDDAIEGNEGHKNRQNHDVGH